MNRSWSRFLLLTDSEEKSKKNIIIFFLKEKSNFPSSGKSSQEICREKGLL